MSFTTTTPNMALVLPEPTLELGPAWAVEINAAFTQIDSHNHTGGQGVQIPSAGLNINADLSFQSTNQLSIRSSRYIDVGTPLSGPTDLRSIYVAGGNLYYNNQLGQQVQITSGAALNAASIGGIGGDYVTSGASVYYTNASSSYSFTSAGNLYANMWNGAITIYETGTNTNGITIQSPTALAAAYILTLPTGLPTNNATLNVSSIGQLFTTIGGTMPSGAVVEFYGTSAPAGYLFCDGTSYLRTDYPTLFATIGTACGAADGTHFNVPDKRGYFPRGTDNMGSGAAGRDPDAASRTAMNPGGNTGNNVGSVQAFTVESHTHGVTDPGHHHTVPTGTLAGGINVAQNFNTSVVVNILTGNSTTGISLLPYGGAETRPVNAYCNYIIKT